MRGESNLVQPYSPENQLVHKDTTISPSDSHRLLQQVSPNPLTASGNRECHFRNTLLCLEVGCHQLWGHWPSPQVESHWAGPGSVTPKRSDTLLPAAAESASGLEFPALSNVTWLRWLGNSQTQSDARKWAESSPGREAPSWIRKFKKLCLKDTGRDTRKSAGRKWFSSVPGARSYKNKNRGGKKLK